MYMNGKCKKEIFYYYFKGFFSLSFLFVVYFYFRFLRVFSPVFSQGVDHSH
jgi:hypothetical protein